MYCAVEFGHKIILWTNNITFLNIGVFNSSSCSNICLNSLKKEATSKFSHFTEENIYLQLSESLKFISLTSVVGPCVVEGEGSWREASAFRWTPPPQRFLHNSALPHTLHSMTYLPLPFIFWSASVPTTYHCLVSVSFKQVPLIPVLLHNDYNCFSLFISLTGTGGK